MSEERASDGGRRALEATAFGRTSSPEEVLAAAEAMRELRALDVQAARDVQAVRDAQVARDAQVVRDAQAVLGSSAHFASAPEGAVPSNRTRPDVQPRELRRFWLVPVAIASLAIGAVGGSLITTAVRSDRASQGSQPGQPGQQSQPRLASRAPSAATSTAPPTTLRFTAVESLPASDADGTSPYGWLDKPRGPTDNFPNPEALQSVQIDPSTARRVTQQDHWSIWVIRALDRELCLGVLETIDASFTWRCTPPEVFATDGLSLELGLGDTHGDAHWDSSGISVTPSPR